MMTSSHRKALLCLLLSGAIFITWGWYIGATSYSGMGAFKAIYYGTRCLMQHDDPYNPAVLQQVYGAEGGKFPSDPGEAGFFRHAMLVCVNLPTSLFLVVPLALLPWRIASLLWMALNAAGVLLAAWLVWIVAEAYALKPATILVCLLLCNAELVIALGNVAGIVISLCIIAVWCFVQGRFVHAGILCLAISLALKPHDAGFVWAYFLLAGGVQRKRALQTLGVVTVLAVPALLWVYHVSPRWQEELHANLLALSTHRSVNDPGPDSLTFHSADTVISLQASFSLIRDDPRFYNLASYLTCGLLFLAGAIRVLKSRFTRQNAWIALAAIAALSMLPVYHRAYDAKLLLLTVPACASLWAAGGRARWMAGLMTTFAMLCTADVPATMLLGIMNSFKGELTSVWGRLLTAFVFHPAPVILLATSTFYLWAYYRCTAQEKRDSASASELSGVSIAEEIGGGH
jgi:glycosyl transferase family 87